MLTHYKWINTFEKYIICKIWLNRLVFTFREIWLLEEIIFCKSKNIRRLSSLTTLVRKKNICVCFDFRAKYLVSSEANNKSKKVKNIMWKKNPCLLMIPVLHINDNSGPNAIQKQSLMLYKAGAPKNPANLWKKTPTPEFLLKTLFKKKPHRRCPLCESIETSTAFNDNKKKQHILQ